MQKRTSGASLTSTLAEEFAGNMLSVCGVIGDQKLAYHRQTAADAVIIESAGHSRGWGEGKIEETYSCCSGWAGCEPCRGWRGCGNGRFVEGPRAPGEAHDLSFQDDWDEMKEGERPTASPRGFKIGGKEGEGNSERAGGGRYRR